MAEQKVNWDSFSLSDLKAISEENWDAVSTPALKALSGEGFGTGETLSRSFERAATSTLRGLSEFFGNDLDFYNRAFGYQTDLEKEQEFRMMADSNTGAAITGIIAGSIADPTNLIPLARAKNIKEFITQGAGIGAVVGALEPTYEEEFGDSRLKNTLIGTGFGATVGGLLGKLVSKFEASKTAAVESAMGDTRRVDEIINKATEDAPPSLITPDEFSQLLSIQRRIDSGENVSAPELRFVEDISTRLPPLTQDARRAVDIKERISNGEIISVEDDRFLSDFNKFNKPIFEAPPTTVKFMDPVEASANPLTKATVDSGSEVSIGKAMAESEQIAFKTGDYRDYLRTSATRFANIRPEQFARMIDPSNPYRSANVKVLVSKTEDDQEALQQVYGALQGRFKYERQAGKTFKETTEEGQQMIPEDVAVEALLNKKVQEILPPEVLASAVKATRNAIDDLTNARELARVARERGSDEGYAVLQSMMTKAAGLLGAVEGNASNLGRALNYQKQLNKLIAENKQLTPFLGGRSC
jgi:hypothetical protein